MWKNYAGVEDLLCDESFLSWYFKTDEHAMRKWEQWMADNPGNDHRVRQATDLLRSLHLAEAEMTSGHISHAEVLLLKKIRRAGKRTGAQVISLRRKWWMAAAGVIALAIAAYSIAQYRPGLHTVYGEVKNNRLPDGTEVVVNADSRVTWSSGWKDGKDREVWLAGEAFFHVRKTPQKSRFIVHADHFDVIVTGTQFNVVNRQGKANVMLQEGSVTLQMEGKELKMTPGDFVEYSQDQLVKRTVKQDSVIAWKDHKLSFEGTPLKQVAAIIKEQYGVNVRLADEAVANRTVTGIMPNENLDVLLRSLEATAEFQVIRQGDEIIIQDRTQ
jgi:transmembrane sensor